MYPAPDLVVENLTVQDQRQSVVPMVSCAQPDEEHSIHHAPPLQEGYSTLEKGKELRQCLV